MEERIINIWKPIEFTKNWEQCDTSILDDLAPSWFAKREELKEGNKEYEQFLDRLKRQHAIETGVIEKLYDLSEGITETFIKEGFVESYLSHEDTNIPPQQLMGYLKDHFTAMDFIFDLVKNETPLSIGFILQLHQLITKNQDYTIAINTLGQKTQVKLLKGEFKQHENNPKREDGAKYLYCPPLQVRSEMDKLIEIHEKLWGNNINPLIISSWIHHAFTIIHPFQDGNGRMARLLASLVLIRGKLFPFTVKREEKVKYINALEKADKSEPQDLVTFFCEVQKRNIENALNYKVEKPQNSISEVAKLFSEKIEIFTSRKKEEREAVLQKNRDGVFDFVYSLLGTAQQELFQIISKDKALIKVIAAKPNDDKHFWYTQQIVNYANTHDYYFNKFLPRGWFKISFSISQGKRYDLVISIHHYSYNDSVIAIGSFLEFVEDIPHNDSEEEKTTIPINLRPYTISLETEPKKQNIEHYVRDIIKIGLTIIANEIG
ncbi:Fic family protein [Niabella sp.]|uniref:Fic family protein n=1 Tax=Niabella sp. TaxID=1962976 RepID=UPI0026076D58|nr:Fic family protein [Niabella sp.]